MYEYGIKACILNNTYSNIIFYNTAPQQYIHRGDKRYLIIDYALKQHQRRCRRCRRRIVKSRLRSTCHAPIQVSFAQLLVQYYINDKTADRSIGRDLSPRGVLK